MSALRLLLVASLLSPAVLTGQIAVDNSLTVTELLEDVLLGQGVSASNVTFNGQPGNQVFIQAAEFDGTLSNVGVPLGNIGLTAGVFMACGEVNTVLGPNTTSGNTLPAGGMNLGGDVDLDDIASPNPSYDAAVLEFDFIPTGDTLKFRYVFASEEYLEFVNSSYNDIFGFFLSGPGINGPYTNNAENIALVPGTSQPVSINNVNDGMNSDYYVDNGDGFTTPWSTDVQCNQFDGMTAILEARAIVECGVQYHIKLALADAGDHVLDSGVFLEAGSFTSTGQVIPSLTVGEVSANDSTMFEGCGLVPFFFHRMGDTTNIDTVSIVVGGTATPGVDYFPAIPSQFIYYEGDTMIEYPLNVPMDADGLETITITITQNIVCSGSQVVNEYLFYIDGFTPIVTETADVFGDCGGSYVLTPAISGGTSEKEILWDTGEETFTIEVAPGETTVYHFTVTDTCGVEAVSDSITVTIPVYPALAMEVSPLTLIDCLGNGDIAVLQTTGGDGDYSYGWTLSGADAGSTPTINVPAANPNVFYVATVTDGCGSTVTDSVEVGTVALDSMVVDAPDRTVICLGDTTTLEVLGVTGGNGVYSYEWTNSEQQTVSLQDTLQVGVPADAVYTLTVRDQCGNEAVEAVYSLIPHPAPFTVDLTGDTVLCLGDSLQLWAQVGGGSGYYTIEWVDQDQSDPHLMVGPEVNAQYRVRIHDQCGEMITDEVNVGVEQPIVHIEATNAGQDDWVFEAATLPTFCRSYRWDLGDGTLSRERTLAHSYLDLEEHWVKLSVVTHTGCTGVDSVLIRPPGQLFFPNAFTPDGDGINELFGPGTRYIEQFEMSVYDRWGQLVYSTEDVNKPWDGKVGGTEAPTSVYVFKYRASGHLFPPQEGFGHVTLLRGSDD
ncbi:MAG: choice-of-anchor L domain-containing protein [Flavobacteriales bacterium]|nr:choice-of-anchor L domain-containing protein [Flavobacteriales bacterium]